MGKTASKPQITVSQIRKIYAQARELGLDNDLLHIHIHTVTGRDSVRELTKEEAVQVIDSMDGRHPAAGRKRMTEKQFRYISMLMKDLGWVTPEGRPDYKRLNGFCEKRYGISSYRWLDAGDASKVIEGLKGMLEREAGNEERN